MTPTLEIKHLQVLASGTALVNIDRLTLHAGRPLTLMGETGAGKSLLLQAIMATLPEGLSAEGLILIAGKAADDAHRQTLWGEGLALLPQEPMLALDPLMRAMPQLSEVHRWVRRLTPAASDSAAAAALEQIGLGSAGSRLPGELSGGMAQRLAFAVATAGGADILLADEPTKGLDTHSRDSVLELLADHGTDRTLLTVTHDLAVPRRLGGELVIIRNGAIVEQGPAGELLAAPGHAYTRALLAADEPVTVPSTAIETAEPVIAAEGIAAARGNRNLFEAVDLSIRQGEIVGLAGPSGIGKSSLGDALLGLLPVQQGQIHRKHDSEGLKFQKLYQDPPAAFAAKIPLKRLLRDLLELHQLSAADLEALLESMGIDDAVLERPAEAVSGGELQRIALARVLLLDPVFLVADEPVSRLDPITARQVLNLLVRRARERHCAVLLISHDQQQLQQLCDRVFNLRPPTTDAVGAARLVRT